MSAGPARDTLLLDQVVWDLVRDAAGNWPAIASAPYALAQDAASSIKVFTGDYWYDMTEGIPYFGEILVAPPPLPLMKSSFNSQAAKVSGVTNARTFISGLVGRKVTGQVQIAGPDGATIGVGF